MYSYIIYYNYNVIYPHFSKLIELDVNIGEHEIFKKYSGGNITLFGTLVPHALFD